jgi:hypothetical protein
LYASQAFIVSQSRDQTTGILIHRSLFESLKNISITFNNGL